MLTPGTCGWLWEGDVAQAGLLLSCPPGALKHSNTSGTPTPDVALHIHKAVVGWTIAQYCEMYNAELCAVSHQHACSMYACVFIF